MDTLLYENTKKSVEFMGKKTKSKINEDESGYTKMLYDIPLNANMSKKWHDILGMDFEEYDEDKDLSLNQLGKFETINDENDRSGSLDDDDDTDEHKHKSKGEQSEKEKNRKIKELNEKIDKIRKEQADTIKHKIKYEKLLKEASDEDKELVNSLIESSKQRLAEQNKKITKYKLKIEKLNNPPQTEQTEKQANQPEQQNTTLNDNSKPQNIAGNIPNNPPQTTQGQGNQNTSANTNQITKNKTPPNKPLPAIPTKRTKSAEQGNQNTSANTNQTTEPTEEHETTNKPLLNATENQQQPEQTQEQASQNTLLESHEKVENPLLSKIKGTFKNKFSDAKTTFKGVKKTFKKLKKSLSEKGDLRKKFEEETKSTEGKYEESKLRYAHAAVDMAMDTISNFKNSLKENVDEAKKEENAEGKYINISETEKMTDWGKKLKEKAKKIMKQNYGVASTDNAKEVKEILKQLLEANSLGPVRDRPLSKLNQKYNSIMSMYDYLGDNNEIGTDSTKQIDDFGGSFEEALLSDKETALLMRKFRFTDMFEDAVNETLDEIFNSSRIGGKKQNIKGRDAETMMILASLLRQESASDVSKTNCYQYQYEMLKDIIDQKDDYGRDSEKRKPKEKIPEASTYLYANVFAVVCKYMYELYGNRDKLEKIINAKNGQANNILSGLGTEMYKIKNIKNMYTKPSDTSFELDINYGKLVWSEKNKTKEKTIILTKNIKELIGAIEKIKSSVDSYTQDDVAYEHDSDAIIDNLKVLHRSAKLDDNTLKTILGYCKKAFTNTNSISQLFELKTLQQMAKDAIDKKSNTDQDTTKQDQNQTKSQERPNPALTQNP